MAELLQMSEVLSAIEQAFRDCALGQGQMPPKSYIKTSRGDFRAMPGALPGAVGIKWVSVHPRNPGHGLPTVMGVYIYSDPDTGYPLAIMDATEITAFRTAAASAIASKYLARPDSNTLGLVGAGRQAYMHLKSHALLFNLKAVRIYDVRSEAIDAFINSFPQFDVKKASLEEATASDIVCTLTPAKNPVVEASWVRPGTHINAVGADAPGKQELDPKILEMAQVIVDDIAQASHGGEINVALREGLFKKEQVWGTLDKIIIGAKPGRRDAQAITVFDSTGLAIEDVAVAHSVYRKAKEKGKYLALEII